MHTVTEQKLLISMVTGTQICDLIMWEHHCSNDNVIIVTGRSGLNVHEHIWLLH